MASLVPHAETTAANLARVLRVHTLPSHRWEPHQRASAARRLLEELGVRCDESAALHDLKGFLLSSPRGTEMVVSRELTDDERVEVYAHLIAHALLGPDGPELALAGYYVPWNEADLVAFDDLLRSYRRLSLIDQIVLRGRLLWHILGIEASEESDG